MKRPLSDIRVCDLSQNLAGPFCAQILGDLGAEIIKVEPPSGDTARPWGPPFWGDDSVLFLSVSRNKRSIMLDLKAEEGREALRRLIATSDVLVASARVGVPERLGYDYETARALRDDIVYLSVTAYGERGPRKNHPGYDPLMQAYAGIMSVTGHPDGPPARVGGSVVDFGTGMWGAIAVLGALRSRDRTGEGSKLEISLLDTSVGWVSYHIMGYLATGEVPGPMGSGLGSIVPYQAFETGDGGSVMIAAGNDGIFRRLCRALDAPELAEDSRFATNPKRVALRDELVPVLEEIISGYETDELVRVLEEHSVPCSPIQDIAEVAADPQVEAAELIPRATHSQVDEYRDVAIALRMDGERPRGVLPPPGPGEHTEEILGELGYDDEEMRALMEKGIAVDARRGRTADDEAAD
ncbi:MAG: CaiB/BaiF CoA transferase family protein [Gemmatimonadota bacterium]